MQHPEDKAGWIVREERKAIANSIARANTPTFINHLGEVKPRKISRMAEKFAEALAKANANDPDKFSL